MVKLDAKRVLVGRGGAVVAINGEQENVEKL